MISIPITLLRWGGGILAGGLVLSAGFSGADLLAQHSVTEQPRRLDAAPQVNVSANGLINVTVDPKATAVDVTAGARAGLNAPRLRTSTGVGHLAIDYSCPWQVSGSCDTQLDVRVPPGTELNVTSESGGVVARTAGAVSEQAPLVARADLGEVQVEDWHGSVSASSTTGSVDVARVDGDVEALSSSGDLNIAAVTGTCRASSTTGRVSIARAQSDINASSGTGQVFVVAAHDAGPVNLDATSHTGHVDIGAPTSPDSPITVILHSDTEDVSYTRESAPQSPAPPQ